MGLLLTRLYRYFANRDELLTALVIDAYADLRDALAGAADAESPGTAEGRLGALAHAYRSWAITEPHRYRLLFNAPLPAYDPHAEPLAAAARSLMAVLLAVVDAPATPGSGQLPRDPVRAEQVLAARGARTHGFRLAVAVWSRVHGFVSLEIGGAYAAMGMDADALFEDEVRALGAL
ncbi:TetR-like C-terminal domain-containing protein [Mariniluteicoccus flavus]